MVGVGGGGGGDTRTGSLELGSVWMHKSLSCYVFRSRVSNQQGFNRDGFSALAALWGCGAAGNLPLCSTSIAALICCCGVCCGTELLGPSDGAAPCVIPWPSWSDSSSSSGAGETTLWGEVCCLVGSGRS